MKETLRQLELFLTKQQAISPEPTSPPEADKNEVEAARLCLVAQFFQQQPYSELNKPCLLAKRSEIQAACKSQSLDFAEIERLAESQMSKSVCDFYRKCNSDQSSPAQCQSCGGNSSCKIIKSRINWKALSRHGRDRLISMDLLGCLFPPQGRTSSGKSSRRSILQRRRDIPTTCGKWRKHEFQGY